MCPVVVLPWRSPIQTAEEAATIDILSGGRLTLGVGAGYQALEFNGMGADITQARARFREYIDVILRCWQDEPLTYKGEFIDVTDLNVLPKPIQDPIPIHVAVSTSPESVDFAASRGLPIMVGGPTAVIGQIPDLSVAGSDLEKQQFREIIGHHKKMVAEARETAVRRINLSDFLAHIGYVPRRRLFVPGLVDRPYNLKAGAVSGVVGGSVGDRTSSGKVSALFTRSKRLKKQPVSTGKTSGRFSPGN